MPAIGERRAGLRGGPYGGNDLIPLDPADTSILGVQEWNGREWVWVAPGDLVSLKTAEAATASAFTGRGVLLGLFGFALMTAWWPGEVGGGLVGAAVVLRWGVLALACCWLLFCGPIRVTLAHIAGGAFLALAAASLAWSGAWYDSVDALLKLLILAGVFMVGSTVKCSLRPFYVGAALGIGVSGLLGIVDMLGVRWPYQQWQPGGGLFVNPLFLAESAALVAVACAASVPNTGHGAPKLSWWPLILIAPALAVPISTGTGRGPVMALVVCGLVVIWRVRWAPLAAAAMLGMLTVAVWLRPATVTERMGMWSDAVWGLTLFGHGFGSFGAVFPEYASRTNPEVLYRFEHPHNMVVEIAFELGLPGVLLAAWFFWLLIKPAIRNVSAEGLVLIAFLVEAAFAFPDRLPATAGMALFVAGKLSLDLPRWRDAVVAGRDRLWAGDGKRDGSRVVRRITGIRRVLSVQFHFPHRAGARVVRGVEAGA